MLHAYHRHRVRRASDAPGVHGPRSAPEAPEGFDGPETLDRCDAYVVLVVDPETGAVDSYGPLSGPDALTEAERRRRDLDAGDLRDVAVQVVRHHAVRVRG